MSDYYRAYPRRALLAFPDWPGDDPGGDDPVYLGADLTVVDSPVTAEPVVLWHDVTPAWRRFCEQELGFAVPPELVTADD